MPLLKYLLLFILSCQIQSALSQTLTAFNARWDDEFTEWDIYTDDEDEQGEFKMTWQLKNDWTKWNFTFGDVFGKAVMPYQNDKSVWEFRSFGEVVTCRTAWRGDFSEWKITNNDITLVLKTRLANDPNEWILGNDDHGIFAIYTAYEQDPRDWEIVDKLNEEVSLTMKMALVFIAVYNSCLLYTSPSPRDATLSRMPSSA